MRILLTGGGTGGHIYPALALYRHLSDNYEQSFDFLYVGTSQGMESQLIPREKIPFKTVDSVGISRSFSPKNILALGKVIKGFTQSLKILKTYRPQVVVGTGGFVCGPVVLAASFMKIPTVIHEQNAYPGITNKILARYVRRICLTFPGADIYFTKYKQKLTLTGLPIRPQILKASREESLKKLGLSQEKLTILVVGGSRGAKRINEAMYQVIQELQAQPQVQILMVTGQAGYEDFCTGLADKGVAADKLDNVIVTSYLNEMEYGLGAADLVIGRAGAAFIAEITALGIPSILIPYPHAAENHQEHNAKAVENVGGAIMIKDKELVGGLLVTKVKELIAKPDMLADMSRKAKTLGQPEAGEKLAQEVLKVAGELT